MTMPGAQIPPATLAEGPLGLEGLHSYRGVTLNNNLVFPRYRLKRITGLHSKAEADNLSDPAQGFMGELARPSHKRGKTIVYTGKIEALSLPSLRAAIATLKSAFSEDGVESQVTIDPPAGRGGQQIIYFARVLSCDVDDEITTSMTARIPHNRDFAISLRQHNPRYFGDVVNTGNIGNTVPVVCNNAGNAPVDHIMILNGPLASTVRVEKTSPQSRFLEFGPSLAFAAVTAGMHVTVGWGAQPFASSPQIADSDFTPLVTFASNWWDDGVSGLDVGDNSIVASGVGSFQVQWRHAVW
jgi:hypothetical protein